MVQVPNVIGMRSSKARDEIEGAGLVFAQIGPLGPEIDTKGEPGVVVIAVVLSYEPKGDVSAGATITCQMEWDIINV